MLIDYKLLTSTLFLLTFVVFLKEDRQPLV